MRQLAENQSRTLVTHRYTMAPVWHSSLAYHRPLKKMSSPRLIAGPRALTRTRRRLLAVGAMAFVCALGAVHAQPATPTATVDEAKAAHLHRISGFVEWPASAFSATDAPILVAVVGAPDLQRELAQLVAGRLVQGRPLQVVELAEPRQASSVHMLMVGRGSGKRAHDWMAGAKGHPVLVVTDQAQGLERGAALAFVESDGHLRFEASVIAADAAGVRLSSRLLALAERVVKAP